MVISMLIKNDELCSAIESGQMDKIWIVLERLDEFPNRYILPEEAWEELINLLYRNYRNEDCICLSRKLEKKNVNGREQIIINNERFCREMQEVMALCREESCVLQEILVGNGRFQFDNFSVYYGKENAIRSVDSLADLQYALILFGASIRTEKEFSEYIRRLYKGLWFDRNIENSISKLEAGYLVRKNEILYHLFCIETEIPQIIKKEGSLADQSLGELLSVPCSPERKRALKDELTKIADNGKVVCELHTKMKKIGSRKPDRIYFCANVPEGIIIDGEKTGKRIYIYKITRHA